MLLAPMNFVCSVQLVPVFEWEPVERTDAAATSTPTPSEGCGSPPQPEPDTPRDMRLVFKGYEWRPAMDCVHFPRPSWESCYAGGSDEANEHPDRDCDVNRLHRVKPNPISPCAPSGAAGADRGNDKPESSES